MDVLFRRPAARRLVLGLAIAVLAGTAALLARPGATPASVASTACARSTAATLAAVDQAAARDVYANELAGTEVSFDLAQITGASDLLAAVAADSPGATLRAVTRIVYHPAWHIVRLRVLDRAGRLLADLGGPYVIAPVSGTLRLHGRLVGSFVMSVQDDVGYAKLETRYVGDPIAVYYGGSLVTERYASFPSGPLSGGSVKIGATTYLAFTERFRAFPSGTLETATLVAPPPASLQRESCLLVRAGEFGRIAERFASLAVDLPQHYPGFAQTVTLYTGALVFVRSGATQLGSSGGAGPSSIPSAGAVSYRGRSWTVFSFPTGVGDRTRVYVLTPPR
jgi:hypothetical protein